jgi:hypothetical protein
MQQFDTFSASELFCPRCRRAQPVYERLMLVLPHAELYDIRCRVCATSVGQREAKAPPLSAQMARPTAGTPRAAKRPAGTLPAARRLRA